MNDLYPLLLRPLFQERVWGGQALRTFFGDALPPGQIGEAWVMSEHPHGTNLVQNGALAGATLTQLRRDYGPALLGTKAPAAERFPLLIKLLDAQADLSVQVHPSDDYPGLPPGERGKAEMWHVLAAAPGAQITCGVTDEAGPENLRAAIETGQVDQLLRRFEARPGDTFDVPPGTIHALGAGTLIAEFQQSSDTTYRLYDYGRLGLDGAPRQLHLDDGLRVARYGPGPGPIPAAPLRDNLWQVLVRGPHFTVSKGRCQDAWLHRTSPASFEALLIVEGQGLIQWDGGQEPLGPGSAVLVPASLGIYELQGSMTVLGARID